MDIKVVFSGLAGILFLLAFVPYVGAILRGETKPVKATWIIWVGLDCITLAGMYTAGAVNGQILGAVTGGLSVVFLSFKYGESGWTSLEKFCLAGAVAGLILWKVSGDPVVGMVSSLSVTFLGSFPTFVSAWKDPSREDKTAWTMMWISCMCAMIAIPHWTLQDVAQPTTFFIIESIMVGILYLRK